MKIKKNYLILFFILFLSFLKYFYQFKERAVFEFDQEYLALQAKAILVDKKITLIGAPTSVGGMFIGPLYNYFMAAVFYLLKMNPYAVTLASNFWAGLTIFLIFYLIRKIYGLKTAIFSFILGLFSFQFLNQTFIPPLLFPLPLISLLIFYLLFYNSSFFLLGVLVGLSLHLHFTGLLFLPIIIFHILLQKDKLKAKLKKIFIFLLPVLIFLLPLVIFDFRHQFLISKNFLKFLAQKNNLPFNFFNQLSRAFLIDFENLGGLFFNGAKVIKIIIAFFFFLIFIFLFFFSSFKKGGLFWLWLFIPPFLFSFYKGHLIGYYYILQEPIFLILVGRILALFFTLFFKNFIGRFFTFIFLILLFVFNFKPWFFWQAEPSLKYKLEAFKFIKAKSGEQPFYLSFTVDFSRMGGYQYLTYYFGFNLKPQPSPDWPTYTLIYPHFWQGIKSDYIFGSIGVGVPKNE